MADDISPAEQDEKYFLSLYPDATEDELFIFSEKTSICHLEGLLPLPEARDIAENEVLKWRKKHEQ